MGRSKVLAVVAAALLLLSGTAQATALIRITPTGVAVDDQTVTHPVPIPSEDGGFRLSYWGGGSDTIVDPLVLIFGTPDGVTPTLTASGQSEPTNLSSVIDLGGTGTTAVYGGNWDTGTGSGGVFDSTASGSVYDFLGLQKGSASENYTNWSGYSGETSWSLWVYTITFNPDFGQGDWIEFSTTSLAVGSYIVGYGCSQLDSSEQLCFNAGSTESTPFTFAGLVVPEPGTVVLLGIGLIGIALVRRRQVVA